MLTTKNSITTKLVKKYQKIIRNIQEKRIEKKQRTQFQAALMSGGIRRIKLGHVATCPYKHRTISRADPSSFHFFFIFFMISFIKAGRSEG